MHTPAGNGNKMKWIGFTGEGSKEESVLYKVTYYQHIESTTFHSQNGWYFLEAWIVLQVSHLLKRPKVELWRLSVVLAIHVWHSVKTNGKHLKNNLSPRVSCCWAISRGLVSVHTNVWSIKSVAFWWPMVERKTHAKMGDFAWIYVPILLGKSCIVQVV